MNKVFTAIVLGLILSLSAFAADRALVVGIDHYKFSDKVSDTPGSEADANAIAAFIKRKYKFAEGTVHLLTGSQATTARITFEIRNWLIDGTKPGDRVFFFYSGHGGQVDDDGIDEADRLDEVLAPYDIFPGDANNPPTNFIRDDEVNIFLLGLSGRRVVMALDSCHSGTISRSVEPKSKFLALKNKYTPIAATRSIGDIKSYVPKDEKGKDLHTVTEDIVDNRLNGIVIFSAAGAYQTAAWLKDQSRSAFSYSFEMVQQREGYFPTAAELRSKIIDYLEELKRKKLVETSQVPEMEIISKTPLGDKPLFGAGAGNSDSANWEAPLLPALHNPLAEFKVKLEIGSNSFRVGDKINYSVTIQDLKADEAGYLYILVFSVDEDDNRHVTCLFPTQAGGDTDNRVRNGTYDFPRRGANGNDYTTEATGPGKDIFVAFVSKRSVPSLGNKDEYTWEEVYRLIGIDSLKQQVEEATRSVGNRPKMQGGDWQASAEVVLVR